MNFFFFFLPPRCADRHAVAFRNYLSPGGGLAAPVTDSYGTHTLPSQPLRIVSTSVTLTGSLLAIDAPVVASGATTPNNRVADSPVAFCASGARLPKPASWRGCTSANQAPKRWPPRCRI